MVVERGNNSESVISTPNLRFGNKFSRKFDNDHCNDVEKQSNFKKFDCLKADLSAFVETQSVSTFYNHYNI